VQQIDREAECSKLTGRQSAADDASLSPDQTLLCHVRPADRASEVVQAYARGAPAQDMLVLSPLKELKRLSSPISGGSWPVTPALLLRSTLSRLYDNLQRTHSSSSSSSSSSSRRFQAAAQSRPADG
jgi:hypothetical protein